MTTIPNGERRMCGMGFRVSWPPSEAVRSPPHFAASAWADSWQVVESRNATYQMAPSAMSGVGIFIPGEGFPVAVILYQRAGKAVFLFGRW